MRIDVRPCGKYILCEINGTPSLFPDCQDTRVLLALYSKLYVLPLLKNLASKNCDIESKDLQESDLT
jgi:hypothetical protein